jgi:phosphoenolpyruvate carboxykinase (GTP)
MLPFTGYNMSDYFRHWLKIGKTLADAGAKLPGIYCVNWFRTDENGKFIWPGFGNNMRVLQWIVNRVEGKAGGAENVFGITPRYGDLKWEGLDFSQQAFDRITQIDKGEWQAEVKLHTELFDKLRQRLPAELEATRQQLEKRVAA